MGGGGDDDGAKARIVIYGGEKKRGWLLGLIERKEVDQGVKEMNLV